MAGPNRPLIWAPRARLDLIEIWRYYAEVASPEIADKLLREIDQAAGRLGEYPESGRIRDEVVPGLRSVLARPYTVFYRIGNDVIEIVRVLHERRDFGTALAEGE